MPITIGNGGVNRALKEVYIGNGGVNRKQKEIYLGEGGVNRKIYTGELLRIPSLIIDYSNHDISPKVSGTILELDINPAITMIGGNTVLQIHVTQDKSANIQISASRFKDIEDSIVYSEASVYCSFSPGGVNLGNATIVGTLKLEIVNGNTIRYYFNNNLISTTSTSLSSFTPYSYYADSSSDTTYYRNLVIK